jgi:iron complex outermembrane receptor protein
MGVNMTITTWPRSGIAALAALSSLALVSTAEGDIPQTPQPLVIATDAPSVQAKPDPQADSGSSPVTSVRAAPDGTPQGASVSPAGNAAQPPAGESQSLEEIVVSARKRSERLLDIPESISVLSAADLAQKSITTVEDIGRQTPNLQLNMRQDLTTDVVIRGVGAYGDVLGVGFSIDDVPNFTDQTMRLEDLQSVEILKGPQGTLYGGSSIGGLIRYVSKKPTFDWSGEASADYGSYNEVDLFAAQNMPLIDEKLALRVSAYDVKSDGYITNNALGIYGNPLTDYGVRATLLYQPSDTINALLVLRHSYIRNGADEYAPATNARAFTLDAPFFQATFNRRTTNGGVFELNADIGRNKFTSISSYTSAQYTQSADISFTPPGIPGQSLYTTPGNRPTTIATQELRLTSPSGKSFNWLAGLYGAVIENVLLNQNAVSNYPPPTLPTIINDFDTKRTDTAIFGTANYRVGGLTVEAGLRLTQTRFDANVYIEPGGLPDQSASITSRAALPKFSLSYTVPKVGLAYATIAKGMEPGAVNTVSTAPLPYKSETAVSYEIGVKGQAIDRTVEYEAAAFYVNNNHHQFETNQYIPSEGGLVQLISNIGDSRTYGAELTATWRATSALTIGVTGGYLNAKWIKATSFGKAIDGNTIPNAPETTASVSIGYSQPVFSKLRFDANFDAAYTAKFWWDLPNTPGSPEPAYWMNNARISVGEEHQAWQLSFRVKNMFNGRYWTEYYPNFFATGQYPCTGCANVGAVGVPREYSVAVAFKY